MTGISINLLPTENITVAIKTRRERLIRLVSIICILSMFFLVSLIFTLRILQTRNIGQLQTEAKTTEGQISGFRDKESELVLLKDRLAKIDKLTQNPSKQKAIFDLVVDKIPASIRISSLDLDPAGNLNLSAVLPDNGALVNLFSSLLSTETFDQVASVSVESLSRGKDGIYRVSLRLATR